MTDEYRQEGVVPDDDIVATYQFSEGLEAVVDGNGNVHFADPNQAQPRDRLASLSPGEQENFAMWLIG